jgi:hypothetical protein
MTSEGLGEVFEGDSADTCAGKFPLVLMGGRANSQAYADGERGPPSARAEISQFKKKKIGHKLSPADAFGQLTKITGNRLLS